MMQPVNEAPLPEIDAEALKTLELSLTPAGTVRAALMLAYRIGRAQGRIEGLDRAEELRKEVDNG